MMTNVSNKAVDLEPIEWDAPGSSILATSEWSTSGLEAIDLCLA